MTTMEWRKIAEFPDYEINENGQVRRIYKFAKPRMISLFRNKLGYVQCPISTPAKKYSRLVHRLVAIAFIPNPEKKPTVNPKDYNKHNNDVSNLEWSTYSENNLHAKKSGTNKSFGTHSYNAKLSEDDIAYIRESRFKVSQRNLARQLGVARSLIFRVQTGLVWKHIHQL
jgi:DNA-binding transcriptional regulator YiaG